MIVERTSRDSEEFRKLTSELYAGIHWTTFPGPRPGQEASCFVVKEQDEVLARVALYHNLLTKPGMILAPVGSFEARDNQDAVRMLFEALEEEAKQRGASGLVGPMNGSTWHTYRFNDRDETPFFTEAYHLAYYRKLWRDCGFEKVASYYSSMSSSIPDVGEITSPTEIRGIKLDDFEAELVKVHRLCTKAFADNLLYSPIGLTDFSAMYREIREYIDPRFVILALDGDKLCGMIFAVPDYYQPRQRRLVIKTLARLPGDKYRGLGHNLSGRVYEAARKAGFEQVIHAFMVDEGKARKVSQSFEGKPFRHYTLYQKHF